jgi:hypothetical protein
VFGARREGRRKKEGDRKGPAGQPLSDAEHNDENKLTRNQ